MTAVLNESIPTAYDPNESVSPTAVGTNPVIPPEPPAEDDSADEYLVAVEELQSASLLGEHTSQSAESFSVRPSDALFGLEQTFEQSDEDAREGGLPELSEMALHNVYNAFTVYPVPSTWFGVIAVYGPSSYPESRLGGHFTSQSVEDVPRALADTLVGIEQFGANAREEDLPAQIANALRELDELNDEAKEEGIEPPSESAMTDAKRVLRAIYDILPRDYVMDLFPEGVIAIIVPGGFKRSVMVLCESDGGALCSVNMNGKHRRKRYLRTDQLLLDSFLREALRELEGE